MRVLAMAALTLILGLASLELTSNSSSLWTQLLVSFDYAAVRIFTATGLLLLARPVVPVLFHPLLSGTLLGLAPTLAIILSLVVDEPGSVPQNPIALDLSRLLTSLTFAYPVAFLIDAATRSLNHNEIASRSKWAPLGIGIVLATLIPFTYGQFLGSYYETQLTEALKNQRLTLAKSVTQQWGHLAPDDRWNGQSLRRVHLQLISEVERIETTLNRLSPTEAQSNPGLVASLYLQLDDFAGAERTIQPYLDTAEPSPFAWDTCGLILQRQERWADSEQAYHKAFELWSAMNATPNQQEGLASALRGMAHAQNRQGQTRKAEETYLKLLEINDSAETHFLLAQFYEEEQQTAEAFHHASRAMALAPSRFSEAGQTLIDQLQSAHMGCFQIYRNRP